MSRRTMYRAVSGRIVPILLLALAMLPAAAEAARTRSPADATVTAQDWQRIRDVIHAQRDALIAGEAERAAAFATPAVRRQFGNAARFLRMVRENYAPLIEARYTEFLEGTVLEGVVVQPLRLVLPDDSVLVALYALERQRDGRWRIAGCLLAPSTVISS